jgi:hypothetical protein
VKREETTRSSEESQQQDRRGLAYKGRGNFARSHAHTTWIPSGRPAQLGNFLHLRMTRRACNIILCVVPLEICVCSQGKWKSHVVGCKPKWAVHNNTCMMHRAPSYLCTHRSQANKRSSMDFFVRISLRANIHVLNYPKTSCHPSNLVPTMPLRSRECIGLMGSFTACQGPRRLKASLAAVMVVFSPGLAGLRNHKLAAFSMFQH